MMKPRLLFLTAMTVCALTSDAQVTMKKRTFEQKGPQEALYELRCQGGSEAFTFQQLSQAPENTLLAITFHKSTRAAGSTSIGLSPGTCAWIDRPVNAAEPATIHVEVKPSDVQMMEDDLRAAGKYWSYYVFNTNQGYLQARRYAVWQSPDAVGSVAVKPLDAIPNNSVRLIIKYDKNYGHADTRTAFGDDPHACTAFAVSVTPATAAPSTKLIAIPSTGRLSSTEEQYTCEYIIADVPQDFPLAIDVSPRDPTGAWIDGSDAQPPAGQQRTIPNSKRTVTVTKAQSRVRIDYEMVYAPR